MRKNMSKFYNFEIDWQFERSDKISLFRFVTRKPTFAQLAKKSLLHIMFELLFLLYVIGNKNEVFVFLILFVNFVNLPYNQKQVFVRLTSLLNTQALLWTSNKSMVCHFSFCQLVMLKGDVRSDLCQWFCFYP